MNLEKLWSHKKSSFVEYESIKRIPIRKFDRWSLDELNECLLDLDKYCKSKKFYDENFKYYIEVREIEGYQYEDDRMIFTLYGEKK